MRSKQLKNEFIGIYETNDGLTGITCFTSTASTVSDAIEEFNNNNLIADVPLLTSAGAKLISCKFRHGGRRNGAGRPKKFAEPTKPKKVPQTLCDNFDEFMQSGLLSLMEKLASYEKLAHSKTSPRNQRLLELLADIQQERELISNILSKIYDVDF